jgi:hypothetical protein
MYKENLPQSCQRSHESRCQSVTKLYMNDHNEVTRVRTFTVLLSMVRDHPAAVQVWNRTGWSSPDCYPENKGTHQVRGRVGTGPRLHTMVPANLVRIKYLGCDRTMTSSICTFCSVIPSFTSVRQICDWTNIR